MSDACVTRRCVMVLCVLTASLACERHQTISPSKPSTPAAQQGALFEAQAKADIAKFQQRLVGALQNAIAQGGAAAAVEVCRVQAPEITAAASTHALTLRRIGVRVRNPDNRPTPWEREVLETLSSQNPSVLHEHAGQQMYFQAIFVNAPLCLQCHGSKQDIPADVQARLRQLYPADEATDFRLGDLRGAFVVTQAKP